ncbi:MAG TPA: hypothetical protein VFB42_05890 [Gaiellaceae bacterium]|nr:hypothetical protein [Gaiellaceae bacterium]
MARAQAEAKLSTRRPSRALPARRLLLERARPGFGAAVEGRPAGAARVPGASSFGVRGA